MRLSGVIAVGAQAAFAIGAAPASADGEGSGTRWQVTIELEPSDRLTPVLERETSLALSLLGEVPRFHVPQSLFAVQPEQSAQESATMQPTVDHKSAALSAPAPALDLPSMGQLVLMFVCAAAGAALCRALPR